MTLDETGMIDALMADYYFMSTNTMTIDGELVNIDGNGNRVAALIYSPENVIILAGMNKVAKDVAEAVDRHFYLSICLATILYMISCYPSSAYRYLLCDAVDIATANFEAAKAKLEKDVGVAEQYADQEPVDTTALAAEVTNAEEMRKHLNEYQRMVAMQAEVQDLTDQSAELTRKIELARELPATILAEAHIPVEGLTVENGIPLINGLPISNLSDGELLELCVDISVCKPGQLEIILIDGAERLDKESRERLYAKCKAKGLQLIATRVTDSEELEVTEL